MASTHAIYLDDFASNFLVYGNVISRVEVGIQNHSSKNNLIENKVFIECNYSIRFWSNAAGRIANKPMEGFMTENRFSRNIVYEIKPAGGLIDTGNEWTNEVVLESDDNLFFDPEGERYFVSLTEGVKENVAIPEHATKRHVSLDEWRQMGCDVNSTVADPMFLDVENDDFRLHPESPALKLGTIPIGMGRIGIRGDQSD